MIYASDTKQQIIEKYEKLEKEVQSKLSSVETSYLFRHINMEKELLSLYRAMYKGDEKIEIKLNEINYRLTEIETAFSDILDAIETLKTF